MYIMYIYIYIEREREREMYYIILYTYPTCVVRPNMCHVASETLGSVLGALPPSNSNLQIIRLCISLSLYIYIYT